MLQIKLVLAVIGLAGAAFGGYTIYSLIGDNAVLEARIAASDEALITYSGNVGKEISEANEKIEELNLHTQVLQEAFQYAALAEDDFNDKVDEYDYEMLAREDPEKLERLVNISLIRLHDDIRTLTGYTDSSRNKDISQATKTITDKPTESAD